MRGFHRSGCRDRRIATVSCCTLPPERVGAGMAVTAREEANASATERRSSVKDRASKERTSKEGRQISSRATRNLLESVLIREAELMDELIVANRRLVARQTPTRYLQKRSLNMT